MPDHDHKKSSECQVDADCGQRANAQTTMCYHREFCHAICQDHWGNCNDDYQDGCETRIEHRVYCAGDPRIEQEKKSTPSVGVLVTAPGVGPGRFDFSDFAAALGPYRPQLRACYEDALRQQSALEGVLNYALTLSKDGHIASKLITSDANGPQLEACVRDYAQAIHLTSGAVGGDVTFPCRFIFTK